MRKILLTLSFFIATVFSAQAKITFYSPFDVYVFQKTVKYSINYYGYPIVINSASFAKSPSKGTASIDTNFQISYTATNFNTTDEIKVAINYYEWADTSKTAQTDTLVYNLVVLGKSNSIVNFSANPKIYAVDFYNFSYSDSAVLKYVWDFGDGKSSNDTNPTHIYAAGGNYQVCLKLLTKSDTTEYCSSVDVYDSTYVNAQDDQFYVYFPDSVQNFDILSNDLYYGKKSISIVTQPKNATINLGTNNTVSFTIQKFENYGYDKAAYQICKGGICDTAYIYISTILNPKYKQCEPSFTFKSVKTKVAFDNTSKLNGGKSSIKYLWNFGDGDTSTAESPVHIYKDFGYYFVSLEIIDSVGIKTSRNEYVYLMNSGCTPNFGYWAGIYKVDFVNYSFCYDTTLKYVWDFGDGKSSTEESPSHNYDTSGTFRVCLTRFSKADTSTYCTNVKVYDSTALNTENDYIMVGNKNKSYQFDLYANDLAYKTNTFNIIKQPKFGTVSIVKSGVIDYKKNRKVFLEKDEFTYSSCNGTTCDTAMVFVEIGIDTNILSGCTPAISYTSNHLTANFTSTITCDSGSQVYSYYWSFGDGDTSWSKNPTHNYQGAGFYFASLTIIDTNGNFNYSYAYVTLKDTTLNGGCVYANDDVYSLNVFSVYNTYNVLYNDLNINFKEAETKSIVDFTHGKTVLYKNGTLYWIPDSGYTGCDSMMYEVKDTTNTSCVDTAWVKVCFEDLGISCSDSLYFDTSYSCGNTYAPVCGCNGKQYDNECEALTKGGVAYYFNGPCGNLPPIGSYNGDTSSTSTFRIPDVGTSEISYTGMDPNRNPISFKMFTDGADQSGDCFKIKYDENLQKVLITPKPNCVSSLKIYSMVCDNWGYCSMDTLTVEVASKLSVNNNRKDVKVEVYPNPTNDFLTIKTTGMSSKAIRITDMTGKTVLQLNSNENQSKIDVSSLTSGMYLINIIDQGKSNSITERFIKN